MPIPDGKLYMDGQLGAGTISTIEDNSVNVAQAGADINFGVGVVLSNGQAVPAKAAPIYGIALKRTYVKGDHFTDLPTDHWEKGEDISVLRDGTVQVPVSADVNAGESATVDANGNFKPAASGDKVVGVFLSDGNTNGTASLQVRVALDGAATGTTGASN